MKKNKIFATNAMLAVGLIAALWGGTFLMERVGPQAVRPVKETITPAQPLEMAAIKDMAAPLPSFSFTTLAERSYQAKDLAGKYILINFWASWCPPCVSEFPRFLMLAERYPDDVVVLAISSDIEAQAITRFKSRLDDKWQDLITRDNVLMVHDPDGALTYDLFQTARLPETIIVNPEQKMVAKLIGAGWNINDVEAYFPSLTEQAKLQRRVLRPAQ